MNNKSLTKAGDLSPRKRKAAILLADGKQVNEVAKKLKVSIESIRLWKKEEAFQSYFINLLSIIEKDAIDHLRSRNMLAANTLTDLMRVDQPPQVRLNAAKEVMAINRLQERSDSSYQSTESGSVAVKIKDHQSLVLKSEALLLFISSKTHDQQEENKIIDITPKDGQ